MLAREEQRRGVTPVGYCDLYGPADQRFSAAAIRAEPELHLARPLSQGRGYRRTGQTSAKVVVVEFAQQREVAGMPGSAPVFRVRMVGMHHSTPHLLPLDVGLPVGAGSEGARSHKQIWQCEA